MPKEQNYANHKRWVPLFHFFTFGAVFVLIVSASILLIQNFDSAPLLSITLLFSFIILGLVAYFARAFALRVQNRAIRAEENFRYFVLTGKPINPQLRMRQLIALRFASDEEFPALVDRAIEEKLEPDMIKRAIRNWRADHHRA